MKMLCLLGRWGITLPLLMLCSCETRPHLSAIVPASELPPELSMNKEAGCGSWLFVTVRLESGEALPFFIDTGSTVTCFDKSLTSKLGEPIGVGKLQHYGDTIEEGIYPAPKLYIGGVRLVTGNNVIAVDFKQGSADAGRAVMGVLGQDCLQHYCIQLDFQAGTMRFLDTDHLDAAQLGQAFPLTLSGKKGDIRPLIHCANFLAAKGANLIVDTGNAHDGDFETRLFRREVKKHTLRIETAGVNNQPPNRARLPHCTWNGNNYTNLLIGSGVNSIGLRFLARHLLTLNFPRRTLYLKRMTGDPLLGENLAKPDSLKSAAEEAHWRIEAGTKK